MSTKTDGIQANRDDLDFHIPVHPAEGFYETTEISVEFEDGKGYSYTFREYEEQRDRPAWTPRKAADAAYDAMLDRGWTPQWVEFGANPGSIVGMVLVPPSPEVVKTERTAKKAPPREPVRPRQVRGQRGSEGGCYD